MNKCGACGLDFGSLSAFDAHRVGRHEPLERRCITEDELPLRGFARNHFGRWSLAADMERGRRQNPRSAEPVSD